MTSVTIEEPRHIVRVEEDRVYVTVGGVSAAQLDAHATDTTGVHGIADTATLETQPGAQSKVNTHAAATTGVHGVGASTVASAASVATAVSAHADATNNPHSVSLEQARQVATTLDGDIEFADSAVGSIYRSPNGTRFRLGVADDGSLITTPVD